MRAYRHSLWISLMFSLVLTGCGGGGGGGGSDGGDTTNPPPPPPTADTTPDPIAFSASAPVFPGVVATSPAATVSGLDDEVKIPVSIADGEYSIDGAAFKTTADTIGNGQTIRVRATAIENTSVEAELTLGDTLATYRVPAADASTPTDTYSETVRLALPDELDIKPGKIFESSAVAVDGINTCAPLSVTGGEYRLDNGDWTSDAGFVCPGQLLEVRGAAPQLTNSVSVVSVSVGGVTQALSLVTPPADGELDTVPDAVSPVAPDGVDPNALAPGEAMLFAPFEVKGIHGATPISIANGEFFLNGAIENQKSVSTGSRKSGTDPNTVNPGDTVTVRVIAPETPGTIKQSTLDIGGRPVLFTVRTADASSGTDSTPDPFSFSRRIGVTADTLITSDPLIITGIDAPTPVTMTAEGEGSYRISGGDWRTTPATILAGQSIQARVRSANGAGETASVTLDVGGVNATFEAVTTTVSVNFAPTADAGPAQSVTEGNEVTLDGSGSIDPEGNSLSYHWTQTAGPGVLLSSTEVPSPRFTAPQVNGNTVLEFELAVSDGELSETATVLVSVADVAAQNRAPVADAGAAQTVTSGATVQLDARGSSDPDGDALTYSWSQTGGDAVALATAAAETTVFPAPVVNETVKLQFQVAVSDGEIETTSNVVVTVNPLAQQNATPTADAGTPQTAAEGATVQLKGSGSDADNDELSFAWKQIAGPSVSLIGAATNAPSFVAPQVSETAQLTFQVTVSDGKASSSATVIVNVTDSAAENQPPTADAGVDQMVNEGDSVTLDGSRSSDTDGDQLTYAWERISGPSINLTGAETAAPTFAAPSLTNGSVVVGLRLTVSDGTDSSTDNVSITVNNVNQAPTADAGVDRNVNRGASLSVTGSGSDPDADALAYSWSVPDGFVATGQDSATLSITDTPDVAKDTEYTFTLTVTDTHGASASDSVAVTVVFVNQQPQVSSDHPTVNEGDAFTISIDAVDPDGDAMTYSWDPVPVGFTTTGSMTSASLKITGTPNIAAPKQYRFYYTVTDSFGASSKSSVAVSMTATNDLPTASAVITKDAKEITSAHEGVTITLDGSASSDPEGSALTYQWYGVSQGPFYPWSATGEKVVVVIPDVTNDVIQQFSLKVTDANGGESSTEFFSLSITADNDPPTVELSFDPNTPAPHYEGGLARLIANASDANGDTLSYSWRQVSGDPLPGAVVMGSGDTKYNVGNPYSFDIEQAANATFEVSVSDGELVATDTISVSMTENPNAPEISVHFPGLLSVSEDKSLTSITVRGEASDVDGISDVTVAGNIATIWQTGANTWQWEVTLPISVGMNEMLVIARDAGGSYNRRLTTVRHVNSGGVRATSFNWADTVAVDDMTGRVFLPETSLIYEASPGYGVHWIVSAPTYGADDPASGETYSNVVRALETDRSQGDLRVLFSQPGAILALDADSHVRSVFSDNSGNFGSGPALATIFDMDVDHVNGELLVLQRDEPNSMDEVIAVDLATGNRRLITSYAVTGVDLPRSIVAGTTNHYLTVDPASGLVDVYSLPSSGPAAPPTALGTCGQTYVSRKSGNGKAEIDDQGSVLYMVSAGDGGGGLYQFDLSTNTCAPYESLANNGDLPSTSSNGASVKDITWVGDHLLFPDNGAKGLFGIDVGPTPGTVVRYNQRYMVGPNSEVVFSNAGELAIDEENETLFLLANGKKAVYGIDLHYSQSWLISSDSYGMGVWSTPYSIMFDDNLQRLYVGTRDTSNSTNMLWWLDAYGNGDKTDAGWAGLDNAAMESLHADFPAGKIYFSTMTGTNYLGAWNIDDGTYSYLSTSTLGSGDFNVNMDHMARKIYNAAGSFGFKGTNLYRVHDTGARYLVGTDAATGNPTQIVVRPVYSGWVMIGQQPIWADSAYGQVRGYTSGDGFRLVASNIPAARGLVYDAGRDRLFVSSTTTPSGGNNMSLWMVDPGTGQKVIVLQWPHIR